MSFRIKKHHYFTQVAALGFLCDWYHGKSGAIGFELSRPKKDGIKAQFVEWRVMSIRLWPKPGMKMRKSGHYYTYTDEEWRE